MESSSQFINQTRLSKKQQLQLQQHQNQNNKFFLDSPHENNYQQQPQQQQQRCQYFASSPSAPIPHFPAPPQDPYMPQQQQQHCIFDHQQTMALSPSHRRPQNVKKFHQADLNSIEVCIDYENQHNNVGVSGSKAPSSSIKWNRNNIAATMEKYEPTVKHNNRSHVTLSHHGNNHKQPQTFSTHDDFLNEIHHMDYAYAYYEPGAPMRHQNIPDYYEEAGPSRQPPPNSIRALLSTARRNNMQRTSGKYSMQQQHQQQQHHQQPTANLTQRSHENVYEEIHDSEKRRMRTGDSVVSLNQNLVEEEFRRVHNRHQRVLGELNLDVEEMLMPTAIPQPTVNFIQTTPMLDPTDPMDFLGNGEVNDGLNGAGNNVINNNNTSCNYNHNNHINNNISNVDLDSGFSGSNSSYIGSLRYQKTNAAALNNQSTSKAPIIINNTQLPINHQHTDSGSSSFYGGSSSSATDEIGMISLCRSSSSLYESGKKSSLSPGAASSTVTGVRSKFNSISLRQSGSAEKSSGISSSSSTEKDKLSFWKAKSRGWINKLPGFSSTSSINNVGMDEQKSISWEDPLPLPRSNSISNANAFNSQSVTRKSSNSIISFPQRHNSYNLNSVNNNQETSFYNPQHQQQQQIFNLNSILNNNNLINNNINNNSSSNSTSPLTVNNNNNHSNIVTSSSQSSTSTTPSVIASATNNNPIQNHLLLNCKTHKKLEHTPSARSNVSSEEDSWCPSIEDHDADDISSYNDDDDNLSDRSTSLISTRTNQLRLTFNKAKQHLSLDKWRNNSTNSIMPSTTNNSHSSSQIDSPGESMSRLTRWFSMRRGSHQYDLSNPNSPNRSGSIEKDNDDKASTNGKKMPLLQETEEDHSQVDGGLNSIHTKMERRSSPLIMPPAPTNLTPLQLKRRHIISAIVHSENSYVLSLERLVKDYKKPLEESNPPIMNNSKTSILFHRVPEILQCHLLLRIALNECIRNWDRDEKIGDVFISFMTQGKGAFSKTHVLDVYSGFINNFSNAMDLAKVETKRKSAFADFLNVKQISAHDRLSFFGLMVKPVQRFPQFILFLQDLLKHTPQGHHDRMALQMALTQLESLADSLNERKREAEQYQAYKEMLSQISGTFNTRFLSSSGSADQRNNYLLREDNVTQLEFGQNGLLVKTKARRLLLANDKVICVSVAPKQEFGAGEKLSLKWMYHVNDIQIVDSQASATLSRYITSGLNRGGSLKSNHSGSGNESSMNLSSSSSSQYGAHNSQNSHFANGADLANDMSVLMHDYNLVSRVHDLVGQLKGEYADINTSITKNVLNTIQSSIRKKDEEMAWVDSCCLQLIIKQKSGKEETLTFRTNDPSVKKEWITELRLAQLALDCNNSPAWEQSDRDNHRPLTKMPLFVKMHPVHKSTQHQTEVRCGCYYSMSPELKFQKRATKNRYYLWVCSVDGSTSHITILMHQPNQAQAMIKDVNAFCLNDTVITSIDYVRGRIDGVENEIDCVWMGTANKKLVIYGGNSPEQERQITQVNVPDTPTQILYHMSGDKTFIALSNGDILMYRKDDHHNDVWNLKQYHVIKLDESRTITSMMSINSNVYVACGRRIYVLNGSTGEIQKNFEIQQASNDVNLMAHAGVGLWISLKNSSVICLYHMETFKHLQDINISHNILRVTSKSETPSNNSLSTVYVTALMACKGLLWVGTNVGFTLTVPLPRLEGLPIISGNINISYHAHLGPVTFFLPLITKTALQQSSSSSLPLKTIQSAPAANHENGVNHQEQSDQQQQQQQAKKHHHKNGDAEKEEIVKLEKQRSLDIVPSPAKMKNQLPNSPIVLRRKSNIRESDLSRISKTLPRGLSGISSFLNGSNSMRSSSSSGSSNNGSDSGCDVYGLYSDLLFVKEDFDGQLTLTPMTAMSLHEQAYESLRRGSSDPDLAAIPSKVSTLDRRLKMKTGRPRSLDLSNWSVDSRSSSLFSSSGSEESMGVKYRSVSRNSSNASASQKFNGSELVNINECENHQVQATSTPAKVNDEVDGKETLVPNTSQFSTATMKTTKRKNLKNNHHQQLVDGRRTVLILNGGRGYVNWRHIWYNSPSGSSGSSNSNHSNNSNAESRQQSYHLRSNSITMPKSQYSTEGHIIIWEKKL